LHLVQNEQDRAACCGRLGSGEAPLGLDPGGIQGYGAVGSCVDCWNADRFLKLPGNGGLADLPGTDQDVNDRRRPRKPLRRVDKGARSNFIMALYHRIETEAINFTQ